MRSNYRAVQILGLVLLFALLASIVAAVGGCFRFQDNERIKISPASENQDQADLGLGPGIRPLSSGPGEKGSPRWNPSGEKIAFTVDGYVAEKRPSGNNFQRRTTKDFDAKAVAWMYPGGSLAILGNSRKPDSGEPQANAATMNFYRALPDSGSLDVTQTATGVQAVAPVPDNSGVLLALESDGSGSRLAFAGSEGEVRAYAGGMAGEVTGLSFSPSGNAAAIAVRNPDEENLFKLRILSFPEGNSQLLASLDKGLEVLGSPQIADSGAVYFVAGRRSQSEERDAASYRLYRINPGAQEPELVSSVGNDFVASNIERDPEGGRLAIVGRRNTTSPTNLYILNLASRELETATNNEEMEIKTGAEDLDWSPDGDSVIIAARASSPELEIYSTPADNLVQDFYNLYEVPAEKISEDGIL